MTERGLSEVRACGHIDTNARGILYHSTVNGGLRCPRYEHNPRLCEFVRLPEGESLGTAFQAVTRYFSTLSSAEGSSEGEPRE
jgi:hypothetical protein